VKLIVHILSVASVFGFVFPAHATEAIRFAKGAPTVLQFTPVDLGIRKGIFKQLGLDVEVISFYGDAKVQQAFAAGAVDLAIGSGAALGFVAKGASVLGVAEAAGPPLGITLTVLNGSPYKSIADIKGQIVSGSSVGDQTEWMTRRLSMIEGWGPDGLHYAGLGQQEAQISALITHQVAGNVIDLTTAVTLESEGKTRILVNFGDVIREYVNHVIYASGDMMTTRPDDVRKFLIGWFASVAYFKSHKAEAVSVAADVLKKPEAIVSQVYDGVRPMLTENGHFDEKGLAVVGESLVDMKILSAAPDMRKLVTERFLPN
jgi:NitT/TauT family transport system substrate-binding protein